MFQLVFGAFICAYMMYSIYHSVVVVFKFKKNSKNFIILNSNVVKVQKGILKCTLICLLSLVGFVMAIRVGMSSMTGKELFVYRMTYIFMGIVFLGLAIEVLIKNTVYLSDSCFMYQDRIIKYRNILRINNQKTFFNKKHFVIQNEEELSFSENLGVVIEHKYLEWKKLKHNK